VVVGCGPNPLLACRSLPKYSSVDVCRNRLLYAIGNAPTMDEP